MKHLVLIATALKYFDTEGNYSYSVMFKRKRVKGLPKYDSHEEAFAAAMHIFGHKASHYWIKREFIR